MLSEAIESLRLARQLAWALAWRTWREGKRYLSIAYVPFFTVIGIGIAAAVLAPSTSNNAANELAVSRLYGPATNSLADGVALTLLPGMTALCAAFATGGVVQNVVASEGLRGGFELLLAAPFGRASMVMGIAAFAGLLAVGFWVGMAIVTVVGFAVIGLLAAGGGSVNGLYTIVSVLLPLFAAVAGGGLSVMICLLFPRLSTPGALSLAVKGNSIGTLVSAVPGAAVLMVYIAYIQKLSLMALIAYGAVICSIVMVTSLMVTVRLYRPLGLWPA